MKVYNPSQVRNVVLLGHAGSGKTTLAETMLFESGGRSRMGKVEKGTTASDFRQIEKEKKKSVFTSVLNLDWRGIKINLFDTPGTEDYIGEVLSALKVADTALFTINAETGVEVGTESLWRKSRKYNIPSILVVTQLDHQQSNFQRAVNMTKERFGREVVVVQYPYSEGDEFYAIIDVLKMTMYEFPEDGGKPEKLPIPESQKARADKLHNELVESVAENDELLMDLYIENGELDEEQMQEGLKLGLLNQDIYPLFCLSALRNMGSGRLMGFLGNISPSPLDAPKHALSNGDVLEMDPEKDPSMFVFKTQSESHIGDLHYFKVLQGSVAPGVDLVNTTFENTVRLSSLFLPNGHDRQDVNKVNTGDIGIAVKLKETAVNDTLCSKGNEYRISPIEFPEPTIRSAIRMANGEEEDKLGSALHQLEREDPSLTVEHSKELKQVILHAQGEEHLGMIRYTLEHRFDLEVELYKPRIPYRETITKSYRSYYKHKKQSGGAGQYAEIHMLIEPYEENKPVPDDIRVRDVEEHDLPWGGKLVFQNCIVGGVIDQRFMPAILKGIMEKMENGPLSGCRVRDVRVSIFDGAMHPVDSNDAAFKTAALKAFKNGFKQAGPQLMEPVYEIEVTVPAEYMGDIMSDLSTRRGQIQGMDAEGSLQKIHAMVPLKELDHYSTSLKSMTHGSASFTQTFSHYAPVPAEEQERIIQNHAPVEEA